MKNHFLENAFTGIEAAIVLIAFISVATAFAYVVMGAGFYTTQTAQGTINAGLQKASSSMDLVGNVYGIQGSTTNLRYINVTIALTSGGTPMDLSAMVVSYSDNNKGHNSNLLPYDDTNLFNCGTIATTDATKDGCRWCIAQKINNVTTGALLDNNAHMVIMVGVDSATATPNTKITVNFQPAIGAVLPITKTIPGSINPVQPLY
jgi:flagellin FlaB